MYNIGFSDIKNMAMKHFSLAFLLTYYTDPLCTILHGPNATFGVVIETTELYSNDTDYSVFPSKCGDSSYNVYAGADPSKLSQFSDTGDDVLLYFSGSYFSVNRSTGCMEVNGSIFYQPYDIIPLTDNFFIKPNFTTDLNYCGVSPDVSTTTHGPETELETTTNNESSNDKTMFIGYISVYSGVVLGFIVLNSI